MNDDWRVQIDAAEEGQALLLIEGLEAGGDGHDLGDGFDDRVIVSRDGARIFLYAGSRGQVERARDHVAKLAAKNDWDIDADLRHWHHEAEQWEGPDVPLPEGDAERLAEHEELVAAERKAVQEGAPPQWEVRVDLPSHGDAVRFEDLLRAEEVPAVRRWKYLVVGAADEDTARRLATRLEAEAPRGSTVTVEGSAEVVYDERPPNPFAIFGGLGG
ncbi:MAG: hypothetical protein QOE56_2704 [Solirubrobacterales bacterium]|jgi:hypothetical protein|nr:hypothetical protein [Solirubrobacterales bacterium]